MVENIIFMATFAFYSPKIQALTIMSKPINLETDNLKKLFFRFAGPSILGMLIVSMQIMIDGFFVSLKIGATGLAAVNLSMPIISIVLSVALMIISGGIVITGIAKGSKNETKAAGLTSLTLLTYNIVLIVLSAVIVLNLDAVCLLLGAKGELLPYVKSYLGTMVAGSILFCIPNLTEAFARLAGRPNKVLLSGIICLSANVLFDYILVYRLDMGMRGAAFATITANTIAGIILWPTIKFGKIVGSLREVRSIFFNGSSEMLTAVSAALATYLFNIILLRELGIVGVAALTIVFYINIIVNMSLFGLAQSLQPLIAYNLGAERIDRVKRLLNIALVSGGSIGLGVYLIVMMFKAPIVGAFSANNLELTATASIAASYVCIHYLFSFANIIACAFHTAIERPIESAIIAISRSIVFVALFLYTLPLFFGYIGIWLSIPLAELLTMFISIVFTRRSLKRMTNK